MYLPLLAPLKFSLFLFGVFVGGSVPTKTNKTQFQAMQNDRCLNWFANIGTCSSGGETSTKKLNQHARIFHSDAMKSERS